MFAAAVSRISSGLRVEAAQFVFLTRHFFERMFRNDTVDFEDQMKERLIVVLVVLAVILTWSSNTLLFKYQFLPDDNRSWEEKNYVFTLMMILFGIVTVLEWDVLFPDRRDFLNLTPLPIRMRTVFGSKLASFVLFVGLFSAAMTALPSVLFAMYLTDWRAKSLVVAGRYVVSHVVAGFAANFVIFFGFVFIQFILMTFLPEALFRRVSLLVRFALVAGLVFILLGFLIMPAMLDGSFSSLEALKAKGDPFIFRFPPLWFVGLYEVILGTSDPVFAAQARTAGGAVVLSLLLFVLASALSYRRHLRKTLDLERGRRPLFGLREAWSSVLHKVFRMGPEERAVAGFFGSTLRTSAKHRMTFAYYLAVGAAAALISIFAFVSRGWLSWISPSNGFVLAIPLMVAFVLIAGIRSLVNLPAAVEANWIFQLTETPRRRRYIAGLRKAVFLRLAVPLSATVLVAHLTVWNFRDAFLHSTFILGVSLLGIEAAFFRFRKIPFACTYLPGKSRIYQWVFPSAIGIVVLLTLASKLEIWLFRRPSRFGFWFLGIAAAASVLEWMDERLFGSLPLVYEEEPEPALVGFPEGS